MKLWIQFALVPLALLLSACEAGPFDGSQAHGVLQSKPMELDGEQVVITPEQITCGEMKELWTVDQVGSSGAIGRLSAAARKLQFSDDIRMGDPAFRNPYVQVKGTFDVEVKSVAELIDIDPQTKEIEAIMGVKINHPCFTSPLPLMGVRHGVFSQTTNPRFLFKLRNGWTVEKILH
ncbi:MAG: hypothetical protein ABI811_05300 [Acidobacteriota bacterium]